MLHARRPGHEFQPALVTSKFVSLTSTRSGTAQRIDNTNDDVERHQFYEMKQSKNSSKKKEKSKLKIIASSLSIPEAVSHRSTCASSASFSLSCDTAQPKPKQCQRRHRRRLIRATFARSGTMTQIWLFFCALRPTLTSLENLRKTSEHETGTATETETQKGNGKKVFRLGYLGHVSFIFNLICLCQNVIINPLRHHCYRYRHRHRRTTQLPLDCCCCSSSLQKKLSWRRLS